MDGNPAKSCINPLPNGQTGKLYQVEELDQWRAHARAFMVERQPHWPDTKKKTKGRIFENFRNFSFQDQVKQKRDLQACQK